MNSGLHTKPNKNKTNPKNEKFNKNFKLTYYSIPKKVLKITKKSTNLHTY